MQLRLASATCYLVNVFSGLISPNPSLSLFIPLRLQACGLWGSPQGTRDEGIAWVISLCQAITIRARVRKIVSFFFSVEKNTNSNNNNSDNNKKETHLGQSHSRYQAFCYSLSSVKSKLKTFLFSLFHYFG